LKIFLEIDADGGVEHTVEAAVLHQRIKHGRGCRWKENGEPFLSFIAVKRR